jgi:hypothetical protein
MDQYDLLLNLGNAVWDSITHRAVTEAKVCLERGEKAPAIADYIGLDAEESANKICGQIRLIQDVLYTTSWNMNKIANSERLARTAAYNAANAIADSKYDDNFNTRMFAAMLKIMGRSAANLDIETAIARACESIDKPRDYYLAAHSICRASVKTKTDDEEVLRVLTIAMREPFRAMLVHTRSYLEEVLKKEQEFDDYSEDDIFYMYYRTAESLGQTYAQNIFEELEKEKRNTHFDFQVQAFVMDVALAAVKSVQRNKKEYVRMAAIRKAFYAPVVALYVTFFWTVEQGRCVSKNIDRAQKLTEFEAAEKVQRLRAQMNIQNTLPALSLVHS